MNLFYGLCIYIRDSEVGSQMYMKTYGDLLIFFFWLGKGLSFQKAIAVLRASCLLPYVVEAGSAKRHKGNKKGRIMCLFCLVL